MKALLLIDLQKGSEHVLNKKLKSSIRKMINFFDRNDLKVIHVLTEYTDDNIPLLNKMKRYTYFMKGTEDAEECDFLKKSYKENHIKIIKNHYDSFWETNLEEFLTKNEIDEIVVAGIYTHWCVNSTVFSALSRNLKITVVKNCVSSRYPILQQELLKNVFDKDCEALRVLSSSQIIKE